MHHIRRAPPCHPCAHGGSAQARPAPCLTVLHRVRAASDGDTLITADALGGLAVWRLLHPQSGSFRLEPRGRLASHATPVCSVACDSSQQVWEPLRPLRSGSPARSRSRFRETTALFAKCCNRGGRCSQVRGTMVLSIFGIFDDCAYSTCSRCTLAPGHLLAQARLAAS